MAEPGYQHRQRSPICLLLYVMLAYFLGITWLLRNEMIVQWLFPVMSVFMLALASAFHYLEVSDQGEMLRIRFGPLPLFKRQVDYEDVESVTVTRTTVLDGWGIHYSMRGGWVWNIWGRDCVEIEFRNGRRLWIGSDEAQKLADWLEERTSDLRR